MVKSGLVLKEKNWTGLALVLLLPVCSAWGATPATPGPQAVSNESYTLTLIAKPDVTAICRGKQVTFTASLRCNDPDGAANSEKVIIDVVKGSGSSVTNNGSVSTPITGIEQGEGKIAVTAKSGEGKGKLSLSRTIDVISVVIESGATSCVHKANAQLKIDTDQSYSPDDGYGWFVAPEEGLDTSSILGLTFDYSPVSSEPGVYTVTAKSVTLPACQDTCTVHVVKVDLSVAGVDDDVEDVAPGGLVCVTNGPGQTATRTALTINKCEPADWDGRVELLWTAGNVKVYNAATGGDEVTSGKTYANAELPVSLWVEGTAPSAIAADVVFRLNPVGLECPNAAEGCDKVVMTAIGVEITPSSMTATESLDSGTFTCTVTPSDIRPLYQWLAGSDNGAWPATAGNIPELDYSAPTASNTTIKATRWFAPTPSRRQVIDGTTASYSINCMVTIGGVEFYARPSSVLKVRVNMTGQCIRPMFAGWQSIQVQQFGAVWRVTGQGGFRRTDPIPSVNMPATSQFYFKAMTHENKHVTQWMTEAPWKDLFDADSLYVTTLSSLTSNVSETDLRNQIFAAVSAAYTADNTVANSTVCDREQGAFDAMNAVEPHFLELDEVDWRPLYGCP